MDSSAKKGNFCNYLLTFMSFHTDMLLFFYGMQNKQTKKQFIENLHVITGHSDCNLQKGYKKKKKKKLYNYIYKHYKSV